MTQRRFVIMSNERECRTYSVVPRLFVTPQTIALQAPLSMEFSRQEYWSGLPCPLPGDLPNPGIESRSPTLLVDSLLPEPPGKPINIRVGIYPFSRVSS